MLERESKKLVEFLIRKSKTTANEKKERTEAAAGSGHQAKLKHDGRRRLVRQMSVTQCPSYEPPPLPHLQASGYIPVPAVD